MDYYNNISGHDDEDDDDSDNSNEFARVNRVMLPKSSEEYRQRRERNNAAVKKSRFKSKQKTLETQKRVDQLKKENSDLDRRVETLTRELNFIRAIFVPRRDSQQQLNNQRQQQQPQQQGPQPLLPSSQPTTLHHQQQTSNLAQQQQFHSTNQQDENNINTIQAKTENQHQTYGGR